MVSVSRVVSAIAVRGDMSIDEKRTRRALDYGVDLLRREGEDEPSLTAVIWRLFQETLTDVHAAVRVERGPSTYRSTMPEMIRSATEIQEVEASMVADRISYPPTRLTVVSPEALSMYDEVLVWLRYIRSRNIPRSRRAFVALAMGASRRRVMETFGFPNLEAVDYVRRGCLQNMASKLQEYFSGTS